MEDQLYAKSQPAILSESTKDPYRRTKLREIGMDRDKSLKDLYLFAFDLAKVGYVGLTVVLRRRTLNSCVL